MHPVILSQRRGSTLDLLSPDPDAGSFRPEEGFGAEPWMATQANGGVRPPLHFLAALLSTVPEPASNG